MCGSSRINSSDIVVMLFRSKLLQKIHQIVNRTLVNLRETQQRENTPYTHTDLTFL